MSRRHAEFRFLAIIIPLVATAAAPRGAGAQEGKVKVETVEYGGWKDCLKLSNGDAELILTTAVGPRIISYRLEAGTNVFKQYEDQLGRSGEADWQIRGGHRLWTSPEDLTRTYAPDNVPVQASDLGDGSIRVVEPVPAFGIQKEMDIRLAPKGSGVTVVHRIRNIGNAPAELAPWALTVMAPGGVEVIPLPPKKPHPGGPKNAKSVADFAPDWQMVTWPYFDFADPRWTFGTRYITLRHDAGRGPTKIGVVNRQGWVGYLNGGTLFVKRFELQEGAVYPDGGSNFETFSNEDMTEIESLGPLVALPPGGVVEHVERWGLIADVPEFGGEDDIDREIAPKAKF